MYIKFPSPELKKIHIHSSIESLKRYIEIINEGIEVSAEAELGRIETISSKVKDEGDLNDLVTIEEIYELEYVNYFDGNFKCSELELFASYSAITMAYMLFETSLVDFAKITEKHFDLKIKYNEISGGKVEKIKNYFNKLVNINIAQFSSWQHLMTLDLLRNIIVHNVGIISDNNTKLNNKVSNLTKKYKEQLSVGVPKYRNSKQIIIKLSLCNFLIDEIQSFFNELIESIGLDHNFHMGDDVHKTNEKRKIKARLEFKENIQKARDLYNKRVGSLHK